MNVECSDPVLYKPKTGFFLIEMLILPIQLFNFIHGCEQTFA